MGNEEWNQMEESNEVRVRAERVSLLAAFLLATGQPPQWNSISLNSLACLRSFPFHQR